MKDQLIQLIKSLIAKLQAGISGTPTPGGEKIYKLAVAKLGMDASPEDQAPDELACAESVSTVVRATGNPMPIFLSTNSLFKFLKASQDWLEVESPIRGDIIISPTGYGSGRLSNGHTGIMADSFNIMSNNSNTGLWTQNYTLTGWNKRYKDLGGFPVVFFRYLG